MTYSYTTRNGQRVEIHVAADFDRMNEAFHAATGQSLIISSGTRTRAEQESIFRQRYVTSGGIKGRKVYDTRSWNGQLWYRISAAGTVAAPGTSNHEDDGPNGPRSIDIRDTGADKGVMTRGTARDNWMRDHAGQFNFENEGYNFGEPWHKTNRGSLVDAPPATPSAPTAPSAPAPSYHTATVEDLMSLSNIEGFQKIARRNGGATAVDNKPGPKTRKGLQTFLNVNYRGSVANWLRSKWGYKDRDDLWGPNMKAAAERANAENNRVLK